MRHLLSFYWVEKHHSYSKIESSLQCPHREKISCWNFNWLSQTFQDMAKSTSEIGSAVMTKFDIIYLFKKYKTSSNYERNRVRLTILQWGFEASQWNFRCHSKSMTLIHNTFNLCEEFRKQFCQFEKNYTWIIFIFAQYAHDHCTYYRTFLTLLKIRNALMFRTT